MLNYWFQLGKIANFKTREKWFKKFCENFNAEFGNRSDTEYEIKVLKGANKLRRFLLEKYSDCENFNKEKLCDICSEDLFAGKLLKDFLNE